MDSNEVNKIISEIEMLVQNYYSNDKFQTKELVYTHALKLNEEVGELTGAVLGAYGYQRKEKLEDFDIKKLEGEIADVFICLHILAKSLNIDIEKSFLDKYELLKERLKK